MNSPVVVTMELPLKKKFLGNAPNELIGFSTSLVQKGYILEAPRELCRSKSNKHLLYLTCIFHDNNSLLQWEKDKDIRKWWIRKLKTFLTRRPKIIKFTDVIAEVDGVHTCSCTKSSSFILYGRGIEKYSSLICGDCMGHVPQYRTKGNIAIESWSRIYERIYDIWLASGILENWAFDEMRNYDSELNCLGRKLREQISNTYKAPCYYVLFTHEEDLSVCPNCKASLTDSRWKSPNKICRRCNLAFSI